MTEELTTEIRTLNAFYARLFAGDSGVGGGAINAGAAAAAAAAGGGPMSLLGGGATGAGMGPGGAGPRGGFSIPGSVTPPSPGQTGGGPISGPAPSGGKGGGAAAPEITPEQSGLLAGIAAGEAGPEGYNAINYIAAQKHGKRFESFAEHPFTGQKGVTAAGRYQMLASNWDRIRDKLKLKGGFTPENQDRAALQLAREDYQKRTGRNLDTDLGDPARHAQIGNVLRPTWHGIPGNFASIMQRSAEEARVKAAGGGKTASLDPTSGVTPPGAVPGAPFTGGQGQGNVRQLQSKVAGIRKGALDPRLTSALDFASAQTGLTVDVTSGGQRMHGAPGATGSHRHDKGMAGDFNLRDAEGRIVSPNDPRALAFFQHAASAGATGGGASYMDDPNKIHLDIHGGVYAGSRAFREAMRRGTQQFKTHGPPQRGMPTATTADKQPPPTATADKQPPPTPPPITSRETSEEKAEREARYKGSPFLRSGQPPSTFPPKGVRDASSEPDVNGQQPPTPDIRVFDPDRKGGVRDASDEPDVKPWDAGDVSDASRTLDRAQSQAMAQKVQASGYLDVNINAPKGAQVKAGGTGLFADVRTQRRFAMPDSDQSSEERYLA